LNGKKHFLVNFARQIFFTWPASAPPLPFWANHTPKTAAQAIWFFYSNSLMAVNIQFLFFGAL